MHLPRGLQELALRVQDAEAVLGARAGSSPSVIEVAEYMSIDSEQVIEALVAIAAHHAASLDEPIAPELPRTRARAMTSAGGRRRATVWSRRH